MSRGKSEIRSLMRRGTRSSKAPRGAQQNETPSDPALCRWCGAIYVRKAWRTRRADAATFRAAERTTCPACEQIGRGEYFGRVVAHGAATAAPREAVEKRIANVAKRAAFTQPERRIVSLSWNGPDLEVLTTSEKLAHRLARELCKAFGGDARYQWAASDGSLLAVWSPDAKRVSARSGGA